MMHLIIAWRNIWRNPRRTLVILGAVIIGVWSMILMGALMRGMEAEMVNNAIAELTGSIKIHHRNYGDDPVVENAMADTEQLEGAIERIAGTHDRWAKRIRVNAVAANARHSRGVILVGIEPDREADISFVSRAVTAGRYLGMDDGNKIIVGRAFLKKFDTKIGNKVILMSQDTTGSLASVAFNIVGVFTASSQAMEQQFVFVPLARAAAMLKMGTSISEISIRLAEIDITGRHEQMVADQLKESLSQPGLPGPDLAVETWQQRLPMISAYLGISGSILYIWYIVVFVAMGFGLVNTTLMAIFERMREFGLMKALGMGPLQIVRGVVTETFFLLILGISAGMTLGFGTVAGIANRGIDLSALAAGAEMWGIPRILYPRIWGQDVAVAGAVVMVLGLLVSLYPAVKAARFTPVQAMKRQ